MRRLLFICIVLIATLTGIIINSYAYNVSNDYTIEVTGESPLHDSAALSTLNKIRKTYNKGRVLFGQQDALMYGHDWQVEKDENVFSNSDIKKITGKFPAVAGFDIGNLEIGKEANLDGVRFDKMREAIIAHHNRGGIVTVSWHANNPVNGGNCWKVSRGERYVSLILNSKDYHKKYSEWLTRIGDFFTSLRDNDGNLIPVLFRPYHEYSVGFWWGDKYTSRDEYIALWHWTYDYLVNIRQLTNLIWVYSPYNAQTEEDFLKFYPGDKYVDIFGFELYATGKKEDDMKESFERFTQKANTGLAMTVKLAEVHNKMAAFCETGLEGVPYPKWWTKALRPVLRKNKCAYVLCWRNAYQSNSHYYGPFAGSASEKDFKRLARTRQCVLLKEQ